MSYQSGIYGNLPCSLMGQKAVVKNADMSDDMQREAVDCASEAMQCNTIEKDIAATIKKKFDIKFGPTWHCIVGRNFGRFVKFQLWITVERN